MAPGDEGLDGAIFAMRRPDDWLVDDFAVGTGEQWAGPGRVLLDAVLVRVGADAVTDVCGQRDVPKRTMLVEAGGRLREEWWVRTVGDLPGATDPPTGATARLITAPPVYDPGGPVGQLVDWDGTGEALQAAAAWASGEGAVVLIAPVDASDQSRRERLADAGSYVASEWYAFGGAAT